MNLSIGYTDLILEECRKAKLSIPQTAYVLATAYWETGRSMRPIKETVMPHHQNQSPPDSEVKRRLESAFARGVLGNVRTPYWRDGWFGRGFVQLTHRANYETASRHFGVGLLAKPEMAMEPRLSAQIMIQGMMGGWFGRRLTDFLNDTTKDYVNARRSVNGTDRAREIASIAESYEKTLNKLPQPTQPKGILAWLSAIFNRRA